MSGFKKYITFIIVISIVLINASCKDLGIQQLQKQLTTSSTEITVTIASSIQVTLTGGITPYSIKTHPTINIATASLATSTLTITGLDTGKTFVALKDSKTPVADTVKVQIIVVVSQPVSFTGQIQPIFNAKCVVCHGTSGNLTLTSDVSYTQLVHVPASSSCTTLHRVLPFDAANSVLYRKVSGTLCGIRMPQGGSLTITEINLIHDWINEGAPQ